MKLCSLAIESSLLLLKKIFINYQERKNQNITLILVTSGIKLRTSCSYVQLYSHCATCGTSSFYFLFGLSAKKYYLSLLKIFNMVNEEL